MLSPSGCAFICLVQSELRLCRFIAHCRELERQSTEIKVGLCGSDSSLYGQTHDNVFCVCWDQLVCYVHEYILSKFILS